MGDGMVNRHRAGGVSLGLVGLAAVGRDQQWMDLVVVVAVRVEGPEVVNDDEVLPPCVEMTDDTDWIGGAAAFGGSKGVRRLLSFRPVLESGYPTCLWTLFGLGRYNLARHRGPTRWRREEHLDMGKGSTGSWGSRLK